MTILKFAAIGIVILYALAKLGATAHMLDMED